MGTVLLLFLGLGICFNMTKIKIMWVCLVIVDKKGGYLREMILGSREGWEFLSRERIRESACGGAYIPHTQHIPMLYTFCTAPLLPFNTIPPISMFGTLPSPKHEGHLVVGPLPAFLGRTMVNAQNYLYAFLFKY